MLLQTRIHRHTVRKVGATPPPLPLPLLQRPPPACREGGLCSQAAAGLAVGGAVLGCGSELGGAVGFMEARKRSLGKNTRLLT